jgi:hypothetical protein
MRLVRRGRFDRGSSVWVSGRHVVRRVNHGIRPRQPLAGGTWERPHGDVDILVLEREVANEAEESVRLHRTLRELRLPADVIVVSRLLDRKLPQRKPGGHKREKGKSEPDQKRPPLLSQR